MARRRRKRDSEKLRDQILDHFSTLRVPLKADQLDAILARTEREGLSHLQFLDLVISRQAHERRERSIERRIRLAQFDEIKTLENFDWAFNRKYIDRAQIETLQLGANAYIYKPFSPRELVAQVWQLLADTKGTSGG